MATSPLLKSILLQIIDQAPITTAAPASLPPTQVPAASPSLAPSSSSPSPAQTVSPSPHLMETSPFGGIKEFVTADEICAGSRLLPEHCLDVDHCFLWCSIGDPPGTYFSWDTKGHCFCLDGSRECQLTPAMASVRDRALQSGQPEALTYRIVVPASPPVTNVSK